jgi:hypothetical protein
MPESVTVKQTDTTSEYTLDLQQNEWPVFDYLNAAIDFGGPRLLCGLPIYQENQPLSVFGVDACAVFRM